jgi:4-carboxymuconolactone decarboxylase
MPEASGQSPADTSDSRGSEVTPFTRGFEMRSQVLGKEHVARQNASKEGDLTALQRFVTEFGWGTIWTRDELPLKVRSLVTVAMLVALNRPHELEIHLRGAVNNGCSEAEIREVALQAILYCGFPAAIDAMRYIDELFSTEKAD